ncbi:MAG: NYN domain-containing protein [Candidatus Omnitrophica bacterium]|nr:NYN domain-containing protein [Candidatus Omnitrophota bacterium]
MLDHLIVDGYNVLHAWHRGERRGEGEHRGVRHRPASDADLKGLSPKGAVPDFTSARLDLIRDLELAAAQRGIRCTVVFDGNAIDDMLHASSEHLEVLFAGSKSSADHVIERRVCGRKERCGIVVVTDDHLQAQLVTGWGAHVWSSGMLRQWLEAPE